MTRSHLKLPKKPSSFFKKKDVGGSWYFSDKKAFRKPGSGYAFGAPCISRNLNNLRANWAMYDPEPNNFKVKREKNFPKAERRSLDDAALSVAAFVKSHASSKSCLADFSRAHKTKCFVCGEPLWIGSQKYIDVTVSKRGLLRAEKRVEKSRVYLMTRCPEEEGDLPWDSRKCFERVLKRKYKSEVAARALSWAFYEMEKLKSGRGDAAAATVV